MTASAPPSRPSVPAHWYTARREHGEPAAPEAAGGRVASDGYRGALGLEQRTSANPSARPAPPIGRGQSPCYCTLLRRESKGGPGGIGKIWRGLEAYTPFAVES